MAAGSMTNQGSVPPALTGAAAGQGVELVQGEAQPVVGAFVQIPGVSIAAAEEPSALSRAHRQTQNVGAGVQELIGNRTGALRELLPNPA